MTGSKPWPWPQPALDRGAWHLSVGFPMPDVELAATTGGTESVGATPGWSVLFVYPWTGRPGLPNPPGWDDIPGAHGSTPEAEGFRDSHDRFAALGVTVRGLSTQDRVYQSEFATRLGLPFPLLSDVDFIATDAADLPTFSTGGVTYLKRLTVVMWGGRVVTRFYPVHPPHTHAGEVLAWLERATGVV
ncbi:MAG: peroxiredoxin [Hyphomicrobium sp.]|nr:peroxiredoxin [Hyphomicrobium sp.]PPC82131.1 MAG: peroxiredoxin [Hyphomicrobium sp.]